MDENEVLKTGVGAAIEAFMKPGADLLRDLLGPAARELGLALEDQVMFLRRKLLSGIMKKTKKFIDETGKEPQQVRLQLLIPILQNATVEEEDELQDRWAALLANAATGGNVIVSYAEVLKQLTKHDITLLQKLFREIYLNDALKMAVVNKQIIMREWQKTVLCEAFDSVSNILTFTAKTIETFVRLGLCSDYGGSKPEYDLWTFELSKFGYDFVLACESPEMMRDLAKEKAKKEKGIFD